MSACTGCGQELREGARFCDGCGQPAPDGPSVETEAVSQPSAEKRLTGNALAVGACAAVAVIAAFLPWEAVGLFSIAGTRGDGTLTLGAGILGLVLLLAAGRRRAFYILELLLSAFVLLVAGFHLKDATASTGIYLTFIAGVAWALCSCGGLFRR